MPTREQQFSTIYERRLRGAVTRNPAGYAYPVEQVPDVVRSMTAGLKAGRAHISPIIRATARECGIAQPGIRSIAEWLNAEPATTAR